MTNPYLMYIPIDSMQNTVAKIDPVTRREVATECERCGVGLESPKDDNLYDENYHEDTERVCKKCFDRACIREENIQIEIGKDQAWLSENGYRSW